MDSKPANNRATDFLGLSVSVLITFGVAALGSQFQPGEWYLTIAKPTWTPPGWVFGPVWGLLYLAMSVSAWLVWRRRLRTTVVLPLALYVMQLILNGLWSWLFFGRQLIGFALTDLLLLLAIIAVITILFWRVSRPAGLLLVPYLLWVCFAGALNFQIWRLN